MEQLYNHLLLMVNSIDCYDFIYYLYLFISIAAFD